MHFVKESKKNDEMLCVVLRSCRLVYIDFQSSQVNKLNNKEAFVDDNTTSNFFRMSSDLYI